MEDGAWVIYAMIAGTCFLTGLWVGFILGFRRAEHGYTQVIAATRARGTSPTTT